MMSQTPIILSSQTLLIKILKRNLILFTYFVEYYHYFMHGLTNSKNNLWFLLQPTQTLRLWPSAMSATRIHVNMMEFASFKDTRISLANVLLVTMVNDVKKKLMLVLVTLVTMTEYAKSWTERVYLEASSKRNMFVDLT